MLISYSIHAVDNNYFSSLLLFEGLALINHVYTMILFILYLDVYAYKIRAQMAQVFLSLLMVNL